jgi:hypothetical protein
MKTNFLDYNGSVSEYSTAVKDYLPLYQRYIEHASAIFELQVRAWLETLKLEYPGLKIEQQESICKITGKDDFSLNRDKLLNALKEKGLAPSRAVVDSKTGEITLL